MRHHSISGLTFKRRSGKPAHMKTLSGTFKIFLIVAIMLTGFFTWRAFATKPQSWPDAKYILNLRTARQFKDPQMTKEKFKKLLDDNEAIYCLKHRVNPNEAPTDFDGNKCPPTPVSTASVDDATRDLVLICGGAHVTQKAGFNSIQQMAAVDGALQ